MTVRKLVTMLHRAKERRKSAAGAAAGRTITSAGLETKINSTHHFSELDKILVAKSLSENIGVIRQVLTAYPELAIREFLVAGQVRAALLFVEGLVDRRMIAIDVLRPLISARLDLSRLGEERYLPDQVRMTVVSTAPTSECRTVGQVARDVLGGAAVILLDGQALALAVDMPGFPIRSVEEPVSETAVRGPRDGFVESLATNLTMIQRRLQTPNLAVENYVLGRETNTWVAVVYLKGLANPEQLAELNRRLKRIDNNIDGIIESSYIEEMIADCAYSPFPQALNTERPDRVVAALLEGRLAILVENTPFVLVVPYEFQALMQASEDYYQNYWFASAIRILRYISLAIALIGPAAYVAITTFHQEMIPDRLLIQVVSARQGVPFPAAVEMLVLDYTFEILREAGIRLPRPVGQAVSIVGALVIGQAAIQAGLVSPLAVIVVAISGVASFALPSFSLAFSFRILRFVLTIGGGILGLYGVVAGALAIVIHMAGLRTLGLPYLGGFSPLHVSDLKDSVVRLPWWAKRFRPQELAKRNQRRQTSHLKPQPESEKGRARKKG